MWPQAAPKLSHLKPIVDLHLHCFPQGATQRIYKILIVPAPRGDPGLVHVPIQFCVTWGHLLGMGHVMHHDLSCPNGEGQHYRLGTEGLSHSVLTATL